jgi:hypothetical protein
VALFSGLFASEFGRMRGAVRAFGMRVALGTMAAVVALLGVVWLSVALYMALERPLGPWAAALLTGVIALGLAGLIALLASIRRPPRPETRHGLELGTVAAVAPLLIKAAPKLTIGALVLGLLFGMFGGRRDRD